VAETEGGPARGEIKRLIINLPPRCLKSHCASVAFVAWMLGHEPSKHIICASYAQDLANEMAALTRTLMLSPLLPCFIRFDPQRAPGVDDFGTIAGAAPSQHAANRGREPATAKIAD
jgi:hypothetical protein